MPRAAQGFNNQAMSNFSYRKVPFLQFADFYQDTINPDRA